MVYEVMRWGVAGGALVGLRRIGVGWDDVSLYTEALDCVAC